MWGTYGHSSALNMIHADIAWHAKVADSLPSGYATGVGDLMGLLGMGENEVTIGVPGTAAP
ncbi:Hypothetical protein FKW44_001190, partial [Caligus rogercresseyi]